MNKRFLLVALLVAVMGIGAVLLLQWYIHANSAGPVTRKDLIEASQRLHMAQPVVQSVSAPLPTSQSIRLAIGALGVPDDDQNRQLGDLVTAELSGAPGLELVERQSLDKVLAELQLSLSGLVRAKDAVTVGKLLRADWFLLGTGTIVAGTNVIVVRVVDARTGILRDAGAFVSGQAPAGLALNLASFVRQCRQNASSGKQPVYLAIGTFQDLGINSRQAGFPTQLRGYLMAAFQAGPVTMLEREYVETLLQEVHLDMTGLTEESATEPPAPMQSAFWMVTGSYQSYETTDLQVELDLEVARIFGKAKHVSLRGQPGEPLNQQIKRAIDQVMSQNKAVLIPTRHSEARLQMDIGKDLAALEGPFAGVDFVNLGPAGWSVYDEQKAARKKRNAEEALRAFETVLLLEPTNRQAKLYLAACLRNKTIQKDDEARQYYRQVIESPVQDNWSEIAKQALSASFDWRDSQSKALWFGSAASSTTYTNAAEFYRQEAEAAKTVFTLKATGSEAQTLAEARLWDSITNNFFGSGAGGTGVEEFVKTFGTNRAAAAQRLADLYPSLKSKGPPLAPYILAAVVTAQVDTNALVVAEFQRVLENLVQHPDEVFQPVNFWWHIPICVYDWSWRQRDYRLAATLADGKAAASAILAKDAIYTNIVRDPVFGDLDRMSMAFAYLGTQQWEKALRIFQTYSNQPCSVLQDGPWERFGTVVLTGREADYCRQKLGLPITRKGTVFQMGKPVLPLCKDQIFIVDDQGLWLGLYHLLLYVDFNLKTNLVVSLPMDNPASITAICLTPTNMWIGTDGGGLYDFDKGHQFRHLGEQDGLLMDKIASLCLTRDSLWIGYGRKVREVELKSEGGLGRIDLRTRQVTSFMPSVLGSPKVSGGSAMPAPAGTPTRNSVLAIAEGEPGEIWLIAESQTPLLSRYRTRENAWDPAVYYACNCVLRGEGHLYAGRFWNYFGENRTDPSLGVGILDLSDKNHAWRELKRSEELSPGRVTALALSGGKLWVGGFGYIAMVDPAKDELCAMATVQAESIDCLQTGGGFLWAQFNCQLYRAELANLSAAQSSK